MTKINFKFSNIFRIIFYFLNFRLYLLGLDLNFAGLYPTVDFPVCRNTPSLTDLAGWNHSEKWESFDISRTERFFVDDKLSLEDFKELHGHEIRGNIVVPVSWYLVSEYMLTTVNYSYSLKPYY